MLALNSYLLAIEIKNAALAEQRVALAAARAVAKSEYAKNRCHACTSNPPHALGVSGVNPQLKSKKAPHALSALNHFLGIVDPPTRSKVFSQVAKLEAWVDVEMKNGHLFEDKIKHMLKTKKTIGMEELEKFMFNFEKISSPEVPDLKENRKGRKKKKYVDEFKIRGGISLPGFERS